MTTLNHSIALDLVIYNKIHLKLASSGVVHLLACRVSCCVCRPVRNLKAGSASEPIILILLKKGKVTP